MAGLSASWNSDTSKKVGSYNVKKPELQTDHACVGCASPPPPPGTEPVRIPAGSVIEAFCDNEWNTVGVLFVIGALIVALRYRRR